MSLTVKNYQQKAIDSIGSTLISKMIEKSPGSSKDRTRKVRIILKAPTGAGKTLMLSEVIKNRLSDAFVLVLSPGAGNLEEQTRNSMTRNLEGTEITVSDITPEVFANPAPAGSVFVKNWESLFGKNKKTGDYKTILARENEKKNIFDWIEDSVTDPDLPFVIIIDEAHYGSKSDATSINRFLGEIDEIVRTRAGYSPIIIEATATPNEVPDGIERISVDIDHESVIKEGLMRKTIVLNDGDKNLQEQGKAPRGARPTPEQLDIEQKLLTMAFDRLNDLDRIYTSAGSQYHALIGIQIPNSELGRACRDRVREFFKKKGLTDDEVFEYFNDSTKNTASAQEDRETLRNLINPSSPVRVLIYKQAIVMGWDCPRAQILVGFRHIKSKSFSIQNLGRFLRTTEARHYTISDTARFEDLNNTYIYSNESDEVIKEAEKDAAMRYIFSEILSAPEKAQDLIEDYNALHLPISYVNHSTTREIKDSELRKLVGSTARNWTFDFDKVQTVEPDHMYTSQKSVSELDLTGVQTFTYTDSRSFRKSDSQMDIEFYLFISSLLRHNGSGKRIPQYGTIAHLLVTPLLNLPEVLSTFGKKMKRGERERHLLGENNKRKITKFVEELVKDSLFDQDDTVILASESKIVRNGTHTLPEKISVEVRDDTKITGRNRVPHSLYQGTNRNGDTFSRSLESNASNPEIGFENYCLNLRENAPEEKVAEIDGSNGRFVVEYYHKNPPMTSESTFSLGLQFRVSYEENGRKVMKNFFPDYLLFVRDTTSDKVYPVIVEVKDETGGQNDAVFLEAKRLAAETYMKNTGVPFLIVYADNEARNGVPVYKNFKKFDGKGEQTAVGNTTFAEFLDKGIEDGTINPEPQDDDNVEWMMSLGSVPSETD